MVSSIERFHCIQDSQLGPNGVLYREVPPYNTIQFSTNKYSLIQYNIIQYCVCDNSVLSREYSSDDEPEKKRSRREEASSESEGEEGRGERKRKHRHKRRESGSLSPHRQRERDGSLTREEARSKWWGGRDEGRFFLLLVLAITYIFSHSQTHTCTYTCTHTYTRTHTHTHAHTSTHRQHMLLLFLHNLCLSSSLPPCQVLTWTRRTPEQRVRPS